MFAPRFAPQVAVLLTVASAIACFGGPIPAVQQRDVVVYLKTAGAQSGKLLSEIRPLDAMKREASALLETAGYRILWRDFRESSTAEVDSPLVIFELRGACDAPHSALPPISGRPSLASTAIVNGEILPFAWLECDTLSRLLAPSFTRAADAWEGASAALDRATANPDFLYGRAMGRLVAHELYHILAKTPDHDAAGVAKTSFSAKDVLADRFPFEFSTLAKLREQASDDDDDAGVLETGR